MAEVLFVGGKTTGDIDHYWSPRYFNKMCSWYEWIFFLEILLRKNFKYIRIDKTVVTLMYSPPRFYHCCTAIFAFGRHLPINLSIYPPTISFFFFLNVIAVNCRHQHTLPLNTSACLFFRIVCVCVCVW